MYLASRLEKSISINRCTQLAVRLHFSGQWKSMGTWKILAIPTSEAWAALGSKQRLVMHQRWQLRWKASQTNKCRGRKCLHSCLLSVRGQIIRLHMHAYITRVLEMTTMFIFYVKKCFWWYRWEGANKGKQGENKTGELKQTFLQQYDLLAFQECNLAH